MAKKVTKLSEKTVRVALVYNIFDVNNFEKHELVYVKGQTLDKYIEGLPDTCDWKIGLNGKPIEATDFATTKVEADDIISVVVVPRGGGAKNILRLVALVAVAIVAAVVIGPAFGVEVAAAFGVIGSYLVNVLIPPTGPKPKELESDGQAYGYDGAKNTARNGIALPVVYGNYRIGGNYVDVFTENVGDKQYLYGRCVISDGEIDSLFEQPEINESPISDYKNVEWGYTNGTYTESVNTKFDNTKTQFPKQAKLGTGYTQYTTNGPIDAFDINFIFPRGLVEYEDDGDKKTRSVSIEIQYAPDGTEDWVAAGKNLGAVYLWEDFTGSSPTAKNFRMEITPNTVANSLGSDNLNYQLEYSPAGAGTWTTYQSWSDYTGTVEYEPEWTSPYVDEDYAANIDFKYNTFTPSPTTSTQYNSTSSKRTVTLTLPSGSYDFRVTGDATLTGQEYQDEQATGSVGSTTIKFSNRVSRTLRRTYKSPTLINGVYKIRYRRTTAESTDTQVADEVHSVDVGEITHTNVALRSIATGWYVAQMTDQLQGIPNVTWPVKGVKVDIHDIEGNVTSNAWSDNPADIVLDMLIGPRRGALQGRINIDFPAFYRWRNHCATNGLKFNGVFDTTVTLWDAMMQVLKVGHAYPVRIGSKFSVAIDGATTPVMMFGMGNIYKDTLQINYQSIQDRANEFEVSFYDKDDHNKKKTIRISDPDNVFSGEIPKTATYDLFGVDNHAQAEKEVWYQLYANRLLKRQLTFDAPVESIGMNVGDVAYVQHDSVNWGASGRLDSGSTATSLVLDKPFTVESGKTYKAIVIFTSSTKANNGTIVNVTGNTYDVTNLTVFGPHDPTLMKKIKVGTEEAAVEQYTVNSATSATVVLDRPIGTGSTATFYDVDVINERTVTNTAGTYTTLTLNAALAGTPQKGFIYMVGEQNEYKKPYRLIGITGDGIERRTLSFVEYNDLVYSAPEFNIPAPSVTPPKYPNHITNLALVVEPIREGTKVPAVLSWQSADVYKYGGVDVYISKRGDEYTFLQTVWNANEITVELENAVLYSFKAVAFNINGLRANINNAPTVSTTAYSGAGLLAAPTSPAWTLDRVDFLAAGDITWTMPAPAAGNISNITRVQTKYSGELNWTDRGTTNNPTMRLVDAPAGTHDYRIRNENSTGAMSPWVSSTFAVAAPTVTNPTVDGGGNCLDHIINTDGSVILSFEWSWAGNEDDIDGFEVVQYSAGTNAVYTIGTTPSAETTEIVPANKRIKYYYGVPADKYYTIYVRAFKKVHNSFNASGFIYSNYVKSTLGSENPYQPETNVAFSGDLTGNVEWENVLNPPNINEITVQFDYADAAAFNAAWSGDASPEISFFNNVSGIPGGTFVRIGNNSGNDEVRYAYAGEPLPLDPAALYEIEFVVRLTSGAGKVYLGVTGYAADKVTKVSALGTNNFSNQHYIAASNKTPPATFTTYKGYFRGVATTNVGLPSPNPDSPATIHQSAMYVAPFMIVNNSAQAGETDIAFCRLRKMPSGENKIFRPLSTSDFAFGGGAGTITSNEDGTFALTQSDDTNLWYTWPTVERAMPAVGSGVKSAFMCYWQPQQSLDFSYIDTGNNQFRYRNGNYESPLNTTVLTAAFSPYWYIEHDGYGSVNWWAGGKFIATVTATAWNQMLFLANDSTNDVLTLGWPTFAVGDSAVQQLRGEYLALGKLTEIEEKSDQTTLVSPSASSVNLLAEYDGTLKGSNPYHTITLKLVKKGVTLTSGITWGYRIKSGTINGFNQASGDQSIAGAGVVTLGITGMTTDAASIEFFATHEGVNRASTVSYAKVKDPPPSSGGGGGTSANDSLSSYAISATTYGSAAVTLQVDTGSAGQIACTAPLTLLKDSGTGSRESLGKWRWRLLPSGSFADITTEIASNPDPYGWFDVEVGQVLQEDGTLNCNMTKTGLSTNTSYEVQLLLRNGTSGTTYASGTCTAVGS